MQTTIAGKNGSAAQVEGDNDYDLLFAFDSDWPRAYNSLFRSAAGSFYLGDSRHDDELIGPKVTASEALRWYVRSFGYNTEASTSTGDISDLCEAAAQEIEDLRKIIELRNRQ